MQDDDSEDLTPYEVSTATAAADAGSLGRLVAGRTCAFCDQPQVMLTAFLRRKEGAYFSRMTFSCGQGTCPIETRTYRLDWLRSRL